MAEGGGLLNRYRVKSSIGGSNPPLSAIHIQPICTENSIVVQLPGFPGDPSCLFLNGHERTPNRRTEDLG